LKTNALYPENSTNPIILNMEQLTIILNGNKVNYLLNTVIHPEVTNDIVNRILDVHQPEDWYITPLC